MTLDELEALSSSAAPAPAAGPLTLEELLSNAGVSMNNFVVVKQAPDAGMSRWTSGKTAGMYERVAVSGDFASQIGAYIERHRQDCGNSLKAHVSPAEISSAGMVALADVECTAPSNSCARAFLFLQDNGEFSAISQTTSPARLDDVRKLRDAVAETLKHSPGLLVPKVAKQNSTPVRLSVPAAASGAPGSHAASQDLETVVVQ